MYFLGTVMKRNRLDLQNNPTTHPAPVPDLKEPESKRQKAESTSDGQAPAAATASAHDAKAISSAFGSSQQVGTHPQQLAAAGAGAGSVHQAYPRKPAAAAAASSALSSSGLVFAAGFKPSESFSLAAPASAAMSASADYSYRLATPL